jgi:branched-subunit amino acid aminotransferase/4-amino-4-deoxychorismate lyase
MGRPGNRRRRAWKGKGSADLKSVARYCWINGKWHTADRPLILPANRAYLYGDGVFETFRSRAGRFFRLERHLARMHRGMDVLGLDTGDGLANALEALQDVFDRIGSKDVVFRITVSRGSGWLQLSSIAPAEVVVLAQLAPDSPPEAGRAVLSSVMRDATSPFADVVTCNWLPHILALREAEGLGYDEAVLVNNSGHLVEASSSNLFWITSGELFTPAVECGALPGITREAVIESAAAAGIRVLEGSYQPEALSAAEAAFVTSAVAGVRQLISFGDAPLLREDSWGVMSRVRQQLERLIASETHAASPGKR